MRTQYRNFSTYFLIEIVKLRSRATVTSGLILVRSDTSLICMRGQQESELLVGFIYKVAPKK